MGLLTTQPTTYPVSLLEAQEQVQQFDPQEGRFLERLIKVATGDIQRKVKRQFITATSVDKRDGFPGGDVIYLRRPPLIAVTSIAYLSDEVSTAFAAASYTVDTSNHARGRVVLNSGYSWPTADTVANAVTITYTSGYGAAASVPEEIRHAILLRIEDLYEGTENNADAIDSLLAAYMIEEYA